MKEIQHFQNGMPKKEIDRSISTDRPIDLITKNLQDVAEQGEGDRPIDLMKMVFQKVQNINIWNRPIDRNSCSTSPRVPAAYQEHKQNYAKMSPRGWSPRQHTTPLTNWDKLHYVLTFSSKYIYHLCLQAQFQKYLSLEQKQATTIEGGQQLD